MTGEDPRRLPGRHPELGGDPVPPATLTLAQLQHTRLELIRYSGRAVVRPGRAIGQPGPPLRRVAGDPFRDAAAGDPHCRRDMGPGPALLLSLQDQQEAMNSGSGITAGHENLRVR